MSDTLAGWDRKNTERAGGLQSGSDENKGLSKDEDEQPELGLIQSLGIKTSVGGILGYCSGSFAK